jgi:uncharacterized protein (TIGR02466 family)
MANAHSSQPQTQAIQALIQTLNAGQFAQAETQAKQLIKQFPNTFILYHVLSLALDAQQKFVESIISYQQALKLQPNMPDLLFNLGIAFGHNHQLHEAENSYRQAIRLNPNFFEAHGNLGTVLQQQGLIEEAIASYQKGLKINPQDARGYFNLGTALRDKGSLEQAVSAYKQAIKLFANYTDAHNNLGETLRDLGDMPAAVSSYQNALQLNPNHAKANYNMAEFLVLAKRFSEAIVHFERAKIDDWQERCLYCLYQAEQFEAFAKKRAEIIQQKPHQSPFLATLSTHYSINFKQPDPYHFCENAMDFVYQKALPEIAPNSPLLQALLNDIENAEIAERKQARLTNGQQSAGNLFKRPEASFKALSTLIKNEFLAYKQHFIQAENADCALIDAFPTALEFTSSWYVKMQQGGHLNAHIHEIGWISGAVYLSMPTPTENSTEGGFEFGTHGDNYPQKHAEFPKQIIMPKVGDIVLFPSSLFHRTIPFTANQARICIAFDLMPNTATNVQKNAY